MPGPAQRLLHTQAEQGAPALPEPTRAFFAGFAGFQVRADCQMLLSVASVLAALMLAGMQPCAVEMSFCAAPANSVRSSGESVFRSKTSTRYHTFTIIHMFACGGIYLSFVCLSVYLYMIF